MKKTTILLQTILFLGAQTLFAQGPSITSWIRNTTGATGYNSIPSNVQVVQYTSTDVYVSSTGIPDYSIGPWTANPNTPVNQSFVTKFTLNPVQNTGTLIYPPLGNIGMWTNGVSVYNPKDGKHWDNTTSAFTNGATNNGWNRNALYYEGVSFDGCVGHPDGSGVYHHHVNPPCLYDATDSTHHSPIIGFAFDGFPIYGAYAYTNINGTGNIKRMTSSFVLSTSSSRTSGPPVNSTYPLGSMCEDYIYTSGAGDLDEHNGRFCVTPEYPNGIYAYFVTIDPDLNPIYPFVIGTTYYGTVQSGNTGPSGSHNTIPGSTTVYTGNNSSGLNDWNNTLVTSISPNPTEDFVYIKMDANSINNVKAIVTNSKGQEIKTLDFLQPSIIYSIDLSNQKDGIYFITLIANDQKSVHKVIKK